MIYNHLIDTTVLLSTQENISIEFWYEYFTARVIFNHLLKPKKCASSRSRYFHRNILQIVPLLFDCQSCNLKQNLAIGQAKYFNRILLRIVLLVCDP